jgi:hypothetical protein
MKFYYFTMGVGSGAGIAGLIILLKGALELGANVIGMNAYLTTYLYCTAAFFILDSLRRMNQDKEKA